MRSILAVAVFVAIAGCRSGTTAVAPPAAEPTSMTLAMTEGTVGADEHGLFIFRSGFWLNLHHYLHGLALTEIGGQWRPRMRQEDLAGPAGPESAEAEAWRDAVAYYRDHLAARDLLFDDELRDIGHALAGTGESSTPDPAAVGAELAAALVRAAAIYRTSRWPAHDRANRRWIESVLPRVDRDGPALADALAHGCAATWPEGPIVADVCAYTNWAGAYTDNDPARITIASLDPRHQDLVALETLFHEAGHTMRSPVRRAVNAYAAANDVAAPRDLWHAVIFYAAGEAVRQTVDADYEPYASRYGLWQRWPGYEEAVRTHWAAHLDDRISFDEAIRAMVEMLAAGGG